MRLLSSIRRAGPGPRCRHLLVAALLAVFLSPSAPAQPVPVMVAVRILGFNDFHGQLPTGRTVAGRPVGGAAVFKAWLDDAAIGFDDRLLIAGGGDMVGASPLASALLRDEPTLSFLDSLGNRHCSRAQRYAPRCNLVGTLGNHEFDKGRAELLRQLRGGTHADGPFLDRPWPGLAHGWVSANVVDRASGRPLLPGSTVKQVVYTDARGHRRTLDIGFVGAVLRETPTIVAAAGIRGLAFGDEATAINREVRALQRRGVQAIVALIHQGGQQARYDGATDDGQPGVAGEIAGIVARLNPAVDLVISGHSHQFTNAHLPNAAGRAVLVTQAYAAGTAFSRIDLRLDPRSHDVVEATARIVTTYADAGPGLRPDAATLALVWRAEQAVAPRAGRVVARLRGDITRAATPAGESALGDLVADSHAAAMHTPIAFTNPGGLRADLSCAAGRSCEATYGSLFSVQPFGNALVSMTLTGAQLRRLLEQQWQGTRLRVLQLSGLSYTWDAAKVEGFRCADCIVELREAAGGRPVDPAASYRVAVNDYLAGGGDEFSVLLEGREREGGPLDLDGLIALLQARPSPVEAPAVGGRIRRLN